MTETNKQPTKADLLEENAALKEQLSAMEEKQESLDDMIAAKMEEMEQRFADLTDRGESLPEPDVEPLYEDPFEDQSAHKIITNPPGFRLGWKNEELRCGSRGWRGWIPIEYDDEIGRELDKYIQCPPTRMEGSSQLDNKVRRGDTILCKLPEEIWLARQHKRVKKDAMRQGVASNARNKQLMPGVITTGKGVSKDSAANHNAVHGEHRTDMFNRHKE